MKREGPRLFPFFLPRRRGIRSLPFAPATAGRRVHPREVVSFALELLPFALIFLLALRSDEGRNVLVQSSRLERVRLARPIGL
jgi:hypothetical protein